VRRLVSVGYKTCFIWATKHPYVVRQNWYFHMNRWFRCVCVCVCVRVRARACVRARASWHCYSALVRSFDIGLNCVSFRKHFVQHLRFIPIHLHENGQFYSALTTSQRCWNCNSSGLMQFRIILKIDWHSIGSSAWGTWTFPEASVRSVLEYREFEMDAAFLLARFWN
jgi:hypothetical protein